ncbi:HIT family protein [Candidatus Micrarchaeota archaeon]|nr:HIT family protein [Candidatus Micrarchaeota archaeon]
MDDCIFCKIGAGKIPSAKVYEDERFLAFLDINPVSPGHTLLIPKKHVDNLFDIEEPLYSEMFQTAKKLSKSLTKAMGAKRVGVMVEGFLVHHAHVHLIPMNHGSDLNPANARKAEPAELTAIAEKIRKQI